MNVFEWAVNSVLGSQTLQTGAIDVVAIRRGDGRMFCSPFHVKLGKVSKKGEKRIVKLRVNGNEIDLSMKLGPAGEAFFVQRTKEKIRVGTAELREIPKDSNEKKSGQESIPSNINSTYD